MAWRRQAMTNVQEAEVTTGNKLLVESTELLRQYVFDHTKLLLYNVSFDKVVRNSERLQCPQDPGCADEHGKLIRCAYRTRSGFG